MTPELTAKLTRIASLCRAKDSPQDRSTRALIAAFIKLMGDPLKFQNYCRARVALTEIASHFENV